MVVRIKQPRKVLRRLLIVLIIQSFLGMLMQDNKVFYESYNNLNTNEHQHDGTSTTTKSNNKKEVGGSHNQRLLYFTNILLQGQFNYPDIPIKSIQTWVDVWSEYFQHTIVVGPFTNKTQNELSVLNIKYRYEPEFGNYKNNIMGQVTPYSNLIQTMIETTQDDHTNIDGILYIHDDMLINLTEYTGNNGEGGMMNNIMFPNDTIIINNANIGGVYEPSRVDASSFYVQVVDIKKQSQSKQRKIIKYFDHKKQISFDNYTSLRQTLLPRWDDGWRDMLGNAIDGMVHDPRIYNYIDNDGYFFVPGNRLSDNMYIPKLFFEDFILAATFHRDYNNFLECAFPNIISMIQHKWKKDKLKIREVPLCTSWGCIRKCGPHRKPPVRVPSPGHPALIGICLNRDVGISKLGFSDDTHKYFGAFHPIKMKYGTEKFREMVHLVQRNDDYKNNFNWTKYAFLNCTDANFNYIQIKELCKDSHLLF